MSSERGPKMAHESMFTRNRRSLLALLLGALACGGENDTSPRATPEGMSSPVPNTSAEPSPAATPASEAPASPAPGGASGAAEDVGSNPIMLDGDTPAASPPA